MISIETLQHKHVGAAASAGSHGTEQTEADQLIAREPVGAAIVHLDVTKEKYLNRVQVARFAARQDDRRLV